MVTTLEKRGRLETAFESSIAITPPKPLRLCLREQERTARKAIEAGTIVSTSGNGHAVQFAQPGPSVVTANDIAEACRSLLDDFDNAFVFLSQCAGSGFDPFVIEETQFPNGSEAVGSPVVIDDTGRFSTMCEMFDIDEAEVIGVAVGDKAVYCWLMFHLVPVREGRSDYSQLRIGTGQQFT